MEENENNGRHIMDKYKAKIAIELYLNMHPYATSTQISYFLNHCTLKFKGGISTQQIGTICRDSPNIDYVLKGSIKYYYVVEL